MSSLLPSTPSRARATLENAVAAERAAGSAGPWILAFSGGPDSLALAVGLRAADAPVRLVHVDHGIDNGSPARAARAVELGGTLGLPFEVVRRSVPAERRRGENLEAAARRVRYAALEEARARHGADRILTAHHLDDQVETVLLRLRSGSGLLSLAGIRERRGPIWRPVLGLRRAELAALLEGSGLEPIQDPSNLDLDRDRNRIRHCLLPALRTQEPGIEETLASLARTAGKARTTLEFRLRNAFDIRSQDGSANCEAPALLRHPLLLSFFALQLVETLAGRVKPSSRRARRELLRRLGAGERLEGTGWRLAADGRLQRLADVERDTRRWTPFSYTSDVPGVVAVPELAGRMRLTRCGESDWMRKGFADRAALRLPDPVPTRFEVRNRRPGDRLRPLGAPGMRRLKELLIDRKVPRAERDRIPLLLLDGRIAWVPGVAIAEEFRMRGGGEVLVAEWIDGTEPALQRSTFRRGADALTEDGET